MHTNEGRAHFPGKERYFIGEGFEMRRECISDSFIYSAAKSDWLYWPTQNYPCNRRRICNHCWFAVPPLCLFYTVSRKHMMKTDLVSRYSSGGLRTIFTDKINAQSVRELNLSVYDRQFKALEGFIKGLRMSVKNPGSRRFKTRAIQRLEPHAGRHRFSRYGEKEISVTSSEGNSRSPSVHFFWCGAP